MAKIPFDIKYRPQIESGEYKVETRDGKPTRIVCWDLKGNEDFFILALVEKNEKEVSYCYPATGCCKAACDPEGKDDLFIITPEPKLSEFELKVHEILYSDKPEYSASDPESWKHAASELLELARKEMEEELKEKVLHDYWKQASDKCIQARKEGKSEALKDLPRWVKVNKGDLLDKYSNYLLCSNEGYYYCSGDTITRDGYMLLVDGLEKLPKEE